MRTVTECQRELIRLKFLSPTQPDGTPSDDGRAGQFTFAAFNRFLASKGKPPVQAGDFTLAVVNEALWPTPPKSNPITKWLTDLAIKQAVSKLKGLPVFAAISGYKTYIVGIVGLVIGGLSLIGVAIPGLPVFSPGEGWTIIQVSLGSMGLRAAVARV